jgi:hypothetical protein
MSIWIRALCRKSVASVTPKDLLAGISERLLLLTYLYGEDEEDYEEVMSRLQVENATSTAVFDIYRLHYRESRRSFIRVARWSKPEKVASEIEELRESIAECQEPQAEIVRLLLAESIETVGFELKPTDADGMGWPLTIAAAAYLADKGAGGIYVDGEGWLEPTQTEIRVLLECQ